MADWGHYAKVFTAIFVIVNPLGAVPLFLSLTADRSVRERHRMPRITALSVAIVLAVACLAGDTILGFFGISIASFRVGGGILILLMAVAMMNASTVAAKHTPEEAAEAADRQSAAVVPLAIPILAGPGAISTVIIYAHQATDWLGVALVIVSCTVVALAVWAALRMALPLSAMLGRTGINIVTRLMGLLLAAISVEFIVDGLRQLLPGLG
ncbi:MAG: YchE family NAAT transporter [Gammaproteobacteria bacterium]|nr:YchE family NAAT transporter [Gammaproteobacteria bacterium]